MSTPSLASQAISAILAPAIMVSASALFLLGLNARYVALITRIRLLNDERRQFSCTIKPSDEWTPIERDRCTSVEHQLRILRGMVWHLRNAILCQVLAAIFFISTSCFIGFHSIMAIPMTDTGALILFMMGLGLLLTGVVFLGIDILKSYRLISLEIGDLIWEKPFH